MDEKGRRQEREEWASEHTRTWNLGDREVEGEAVSFSARPLPDGGADAVEKVAGAIEALGLPALVQKAGQRSAEVTVIVPSMATERILSDARTRKAGRKPLRMPLLIDDTLEINFDSTVDDFMRFRESHTAPECAKALGLTTATYYRRLKKIKALAEAGKGHYRLGNV